ncbi:MAG: phosphatase PAP2 family protein [Ruminococcus sp.]|nr:phosphatase PAP2 family protein [Ruminococcus sp.]
MDNITEFDFHLLEMISSIRNDVLTPIMKILTYISNGGIIWILISFIMIAFPKTRKIGICAMAALALEYIIGDCCIKYLIARDRPFIQHPWIDTIINHPSGYSFPSGHTGAASAASVTVFIQNKKIGIPLMILAVGIIFSRLYFCVHFPTDILGGIINGTTWAIVSYIVINKISEKRKQSVND